MAPRDGKQVLIENPIQFALFIEEQQRQMKELRASTSSLAKNVGDKLSNLMQAVLLNSGFLKDSDLGEEQQELLAEMVAVFDDIKDLATDLIDYSKLDAHKPQFVDLLETVNLSVQDYGISKEGVQIKVEGIDGLILSIDAGQIVNALQIIYAHAESDIDGGLIEVYVNDQVDNHNLVKLGLLGEKYASISVSHQGRAMTGDHLDNLSKPFYSTKVLGKADGTGVGLAFVYGVVQTHNGLLTITSWEDRGTFYDITLPISNEIKEEYFGIERSILVVENDKDLRECVVSMVSNVGEYNIFSAQNGLEALEVLENNPVGMIISDIVMPMMDGVEMLGEIETRFQNDRFHGKPPVVYFMSGGNGYDMEGIMRRDYVMGFLKKPFSSDVICRAVRNVFEGVD